MTTKQRSLGWRKNNQGQRPYLPESSQRLLLLFEEKLWNVKKHTSDEQREAHTSLAGCGTGFSRWHSQIVLNISLKHLIIFTLFDAEKSLSDNSNVLISIWFCVTKKNKKKVIKSSSHSGLKNIPRFLRSLATNNFLTYILFSIMSFI